MSSIFNTPPNTTDPMELLRYFQELRDSRIDTFRKSTSQLPSVFNRPERLAEDTNENGNNYLASIFDSLSVQTAEAVEQVGPTIARIKEEQKQEQILNKLNLEDTSFDAERMININKTPIRKEVEAIDGSVTDSTNAPGTNTITTDGNSAGKVEEPVVEEVSTTGDGIMVKPSISAKVFDPTQDLLNIIAFGEGADPNKLKAQAIHGIGTTAYDMVYSYGNILAPNKPITKMTMAELETFQRKLIAKTRGKIPGTKYGTSAVGKYQVIKTSLFGEGGTAANPKKDSWAEKLGLKATTVYTPDVQESIGFLALQEAGYKSFIAGKKSNNSFQNRIANIWASVSKSDGSDKYGQGIHTTKKDLQPVFAALKPTVNKDTAPEKSLRPKSKPTRITSGPR